MEALVSTVSAKTEGPELAAQLEYVFRVAYRLTGNSHDAEDLVQDVCERALRKAPDFATAQDCRRWLLRVLYNRFVDGRRHGQRSPVVSDVGTESTLAAAPDPEALAQQSDSESAMLEAWERLEPAQQALLLLRAEGHGLDEIARITDLDKPAISSRLHRARQSLARYMREEKSAEAVCEAPEDES